LPQKALLLEADCNYIYSITLSPAEKHLQILDKIDSNEGKTIIISLESLKIVATFKENAYTNYYVKSSYPLVRFTS
jgi:ABC-type phosphate/phosphonate transport system ATPase subunit